MPIITLEFLSRLAQVMQSCSGPRWTTFFQYGVKLDLRTFGLLVALWLKLWVLRILMYHNGESAEVAISANTNQLVKGKAPESEKRLGLRFGFAVGV